MAATTTRLRYAGEIRPVELKQTAWEGLAAHPKHDWTERRTGGATEKRVDCHSNHGDASNVDGGVPTTAKDNRSNQEVTEHHGNMVKLEPGFARAAAHRRATAMVERTRRRCYRPRGRKVCTAVPRRSQASKAGWLGAQGTSGAMTTLLRKERHYGDGTGSTEQRRRCQEKQGRRNWDERRRHWPYSAAQKQGEATQESSRASVEPKTATSAPGNQKKAAGGEVSPAGTVHRNYRIATRFESQITPKFMWQLKNLQK